MVVDGADGFGEVFEAVGIESRGGDLEGFGDDLAHFPQERRGGEIAGIATAHAVGNGEDEVVAAQRDASRLIERGGTLGTGGEGGPGIVVAWFAGTAVTQGGPVQGGGG